MQLLDQIIDLSIEADTSLSVILRKLLVLSYKLKNDRLKKWASSELDGYGAHQGLPEYRNINAVAKGLFLGGFGSSISDQPLAPLILKPQHRHFAERVELRSPIAAYEKAAAEIKTAAMVPWPPDLTVLYQDRFIADYALNRAWQEIPKSVFVGMVDTVRNRTLRFALELREELGEVGDQVEALPPAKIDQTVTNHIYGGHVLIAGTTGSVIQGGNIVVSAGDLVGLKAVLAGLGLTDDQVGELQTAIAEDGSGGPSKPSMGQKVGKWLTDLSITAVKGGVSIAGDALKAEVTKNVMQYLGMS